MSGEENLVCDKQIDCLYQRESEISLTTNPEKMQNILNGTLALLHFSLPDSVSVIENKN